MPRKEKYPARARAVSQGRAPTWHRVPRPRARASPGPRPLADTVSRKPQLPHAPLSHGPGLPSLSPAPRPASAGAYPDATLRPATRRPPLKLVRLGRRCSAQAPPRRSTGGASAAAAAAEGAGEGGRRRRGLWRWPERGAVEAASHAGEMGPVSRSLMLYPGEMRVRFRGDEGRICGEIGPFPGDMWGWAPRAGGHAGELGLYRGGMGEISPGTRGDEGLEAGSRGGACPGGVTWGIDWAR